MSNFVIFRRVGLNATMNEFESCTVTSVLHWVLFCVFMLVAGVVDMLTNVVRLSLRNSAELRRTADNGLVAIKHPPCSQQLEC